MKPKAFSKRLGLNKKTIANLVNTEMKRVHGGHDSSPTCPIVTGCPPCPGTAGCPPATYKFTNCLDCPPLPVTE